jgi:hypothetical protein
MSLDPRISRRRRGLSPEINPIAEIRRKKIVLSAQQSTLRRTLSDSSSSSFSPLPIVQKMTSSGGSSGTRGASSSQPSASSMIGSLYSHQVPIQSSTNPAKFIKKYGFFQFEERCYNYPTKQLWEYNNISYKDDETIKSFNLCFTKLYNQILELIRP